jgi:hypothetical protein
MKKRQRLYVEEWPEDGLPSVWRPDRVQHCRHAACRRARRCVRPRTMAGRLPPRIPSCPLVTDKEWVAWGLTIYPIIEDLLPETDAAAMAEWQRRSAAPAGMVLPVRPSTG